jgi:hypothetical protein
MLQQVAKNTTLLLLIPIASFTNGCEFWGAHIRLSMAKDCAQIMVTEIGISCKAAVNLLIYGRRFYEFDVSNTTAIQKRK